ncbi:MAG TPA: winged helix-turn-helix domain-containing protein [Candidatus Bathyarchaeia archaeon]
MRRSRFETYLDVLKVLINNGPSKITHIAYKSNINSDFLEKYLDFLIAQRAVEERTIGSDNSVFAITQHGINLLKYFWHPELPLIEKEK